MHPWLVVLLLVCATSTVSMTVTKSKVAEPFRAFLSHHSPWLGKLFSCPYCFSHWTAFALVYLTKIQVFPNWFVNFFVVAFAIVSLSTVLSATMWRLFYLHEDELAKKDEQIAELSDILRESLEEEPQG